MSYKVRIDSFEGPFDLLLYLVSRQKVDIGAISITQIADQYLAEVSRMDNLDLDVASDFLLVASTLLEIKAESLLPRERDAVALARVLLQDVPVVILDEPTVGLDPITERALLDDLFEALAGKTVIMITHHLAGVDAMDRVVFVEDGRIALDGAPDELACTSERYRRLLAFDRGQAAGR